MRQYSKISRQSSKNPVQRTWNKMEPRPFPTQEAANVQLETDSAASANLGNYTGLSFYGAPPIQRQDEEETPAEAIPASEEDMPLQRQVEEGEELPEDAPVQAKLSVGKPGDKYEQEADNMAARVMAMPEPTETVQRQEEGEEETVQQKPLAEAVTPLVQRQTREAVTGEAGASSGLEAQLGATKGGGSPLSDEVRGFMEPRFGADFSGVRVHTGGDAVQMNRELGAQAFTHGQDIYYGKGKSAGKDDLTAHELTHVVQQTGGEVQPQLSEPQDSVYLQRQDTDLLSEIPEYQLDSPSLFKPLEQFSDLNLLGQDSQLELDKNIPQSILDPLAIFPQNLSLSSFGEEAPNPFKLESPPPSQSLLDLLKAPPDKNIEKTRQGKTGDILSAIAKLPITEKIKKWGTEKLDDEILSPTSKWWHSLSLTQKISLVGSGIGLGSAGIAGVASSKPELLSIINGRVLKSPWSPDWLKDLGIDLKHFGIEGNIRDGKFFGGGAHVDVGRFLPESWGFGEAKFQSLFTPTAGTIQRQEDESKPWHGHLQDFGTGVYEGGKDIVTGLGSMAKGSWNLTGGWLTNQEEAQSTWENLRSTTQAIVDEPSLIWDGIKQPYVEAWESNRPGEAIGRGTFEALSLVLGTKGLDKLGKSSKIGKATNILDKADDFIPAATPVGRKSSPLNVPRDINPPANIGGRDYTRHALDRMQKRGLIPSVVENTIQSGQKLPGKRLGTTAHYDSVNNITVITDTASGRVITAATGRIKQ